MTNTQKRETKEMSKEQLKRQQKSLSKKHHKELIDFTKQCLSNMKKV